MSLGIRQLPDDASPYYPWSNAPPGTAQRMSLFLMLEPGDPHAALDSVLKLTNSDRFPALDGYVTFAPHWHYAYTVQAMEKGLTWVPPFKPVLQAMGVNSAMIFDFHGDGHPADTGETRLSELDAFYRACRAQSGPDFLLIPGEEANVHFGGHWAVAFPKPVYWHMSRKPPQAFQEKDAKYGTVYNTADAKELLDLVRAENGFVYQTHPRTKGSMGYPDKIRDSAHFLDAHWFGAGWKALPSDLSLPSLGARAFRLLDDMSNWGLRKQLMGEVDVFQIDSTHELYAHMNVNYVKLPAVPTLRPLRRAARYAAARRVLHDHRRGAAAGRGDQRGRWRAHRGEGADPAHLPAGDGRDRLGRRLRDLSEDDSADGDACLRRFFVLRGGGWGQLEVGAVGGVGRGRGRGVRESGMAAVSGRRDRGSGGRGRPPDSAQGLSSTGGFRWALVTQICGNVESSFIGF